MEREGERRRGEEGGIGGWGGDDKSEGAEKMKWNGQK